MLEEDFGNRRLPMDLQTLTRGRYVRIDLEASTKEEAIELLLDTLLSEGALPADARDELLEAVMRRERRLSTGLEAGIAIPHGLTHRLEREVAAIGVFPDGVPFGSVDERTTNIVILLMTPAERRNRHVNNLACIARQLLRPEVRNALIGARTIADALAAIANAEPDEECDE